MPHILRQDGALKGCKGEHVWILIMKLPTELIFAFFGRQNASVRSAWSARHAQARIGLSCREKREKNNACYAGYNCVTCANCFFSCEFSVIILAAFLSMLESDSGLLLRRVVLASVPPSGDHSFVTFKMYK